MAGIEISCCPPFMIDQVWDHVKSYLIEAFKRGCSDYSIESLHKKLIAGSSLLWIIWDDKNQIYGACTTEICRLGDHDKRVCVLTAFGGHNFAKYRDKAMQVIDDYARSENCERVRFYGRYGIIRMYRDYGYSCPWVALEKVL